MFYKKENFVKIIKLVLLLSLGVWADFKLDIPNDINVSKATSNQTLEKALVSFNKEIQNDVSIYSLQSTIFSMQVFLDTINCNTVEMENTIQDNLFTTISWEKALEKGKENFIKTIMSASKQEAIARNNVNIENYVTAIEDVISREVEAYNASVTFAIKENTKSIDERMSDYVENKIQRVNELSLKIKDKMKKYTSKKQFLKDSNNFNSIVEFKGMEAATAYMYSMVSFDEITINMKRLRKRQFKLLEICLQ